VATLAQLLPSLPVAETKVRAAPWASAGVAGGKQTSTVTSSVNGKAIFVITEAPHFGRYVRRHACSERADVQPEYRWHP
jgi:hypothetical protein